MTRSPLALAVVLACLLIPPSAALAVDRPTVSWHPAKLRPGDYYKPAGGGWVRK